MVKIKSLTFTDLFTCDIHISIFSEFYSFMCFKFIPYSVQDVMVELYRRNIWHDAKTVNVITTALFSKVTKVLTLYFYS